MRPALIRDIETRSTVDVGDVGAHLYAQHSTTEVLCVGYALDDGPVKIWHPGELVPIEFKRAYRNRAYAAIAHNAAFEMQIERHILGPKFGFPVFEVERNVCTMAMSLALALPGGLERIAKVLNLEHTKDIVGHKAMLQVSKPRRARKAEDPDETYWYDDDERLTRLDQYCADDVETTREILDTIPELLEQEYEIWLLDQKINDRGIYLDCKLMLAAKKIIETALPRFDTELSEITNGEVTAITQVAKLKKFCSVESLRKEALDELLKQDDLSAKVRRALELRSQGAHAAIKKIYSMLNRRNDNGRLCGAFVYHAAGPGRWSSRGAQLQNLKRSMTEDIDAAVKATMTGSYDHVSKLYHNPLSMIGDLVRATISTSPGNVLIGADFSGIEARVTAWIAGEERKLDAFRSFDIGTGPDPYIIAAGVVLGVDVDDLNRRYKAGEPAAREQRQVGKACELAFGYGGGVNAFKRFMPSGGFINLTDAERNWNIRVGGGPRVRGDDKRNRLKKDYDEDEIQRIKNKWRRGHPNITRLWYALERAARLALKNHDTIYSLRNDQLEFECDDQPFLWLTLPSGRKLAYPHARIARIFTPDKSKKIMIEHPNGYPEAVFKDNSAGQWRDVKIWGGLLCENVVQAISRDLLAEAMLRVDRAGFDIVAHVHDECVIEVKEKNVEIAKVKFSRLMNEVPSWANGLPIVAKAWVAKRYVK